MPHSSVKGFNLKNLVIEKENPYRGVPIVKAVSLFGSSGRHAGDALHIRDLLRFFKKIYSG